MSEVTVNRQIILNNVRLLRVSLTKPYIGKDAKVNPTTGQPEGKFHVDAVFPESHPDFPKLQATVRATANAKWKDKAQQVLEMIATNNQRFPLQRGNQYRPGKPAYANMLYLSAGNKDQPTIVVTENGVNIANRGTPVVLTPSHPCWPYEGCYGNVHVEFYGYEYGNSPGIGCSVLGVQFFKHGERLKGSSVSSGSEFGLVAADADAAPPGASPLTGGAGLI